MDCGAGFKEEREGEVIRGEILAEHERKVNEGVLLGMCGFSEGTDNGIEEECIVEVGGSGGGEEKCGGMSRWMAEGRGSRGELGEN